jgi:hypothetical protein
MLIMEIYANVEAALLPSIFSSLIASYKICTCLFNQDFRIDSIFILLQLYEHQHQMGLLLIERKEWSSKYDQLKASSEASEISRKRERAAQASALAEAAKREESLKKALGIEKECVANVCCLYIS